MARQSVTQDVVVAKVSNYLEQDKGFKRMLREFGFLDYAYHQTTAWVEVTKNYIAHLLLAELPSKEKNAVTVSQINKKFLDELDVMLDPSNMQKNLNKMVEHHFVVKTENENNVSAYYRHPIGDYFYRHAGKVFTPRTEWQNRTVERTKELVVWRAFAMCLIALIKEKAPHLTEDVDAYIREKKIDMEGTP